MAVGRSRCGNDGVGLQLWQARAGVEPHPVQLEIPPLFPPMDIPADNPLTRKGCIWGRMLFWETSLSEDNSMNCGTCHLPEVSFADPAPYSTGVTGPWATATPWRSSTWAGHPPIFGMEGPFPRRTNPRTHPAPRRNEFALVGGGCTSPGRPRRQELSQLFFDAFGTTDISADLVSKAIAQFVRTMVSADSKFDRYKRGEVELSESEFRGYGWFIREGVTPRWFQVVNSGRIASIAMPRRGCNSPTICSGTMGSTPPSRLTLGGFGHRRPLGLRTVSHHHLAQRGPVGTLHARRPVHTLEEVIEHYNSGGVPSSTIDPFMKYGVGGLDLAPSKRRT